MDIELLHLLDVDKQDVNSDKEYYGEPWAVKINGVSGYAARINDFETSDPDIVIYADEENMRTVPKSFLPLPAELSRSIASRWKHDHVMRGRGNEITGPSAGEFKGVVHLWHDDLRYCGFDDMCFKNMKFNIFKLKNNNFDRCSFENVDFSGINNMQFAFFHQCRFLNCNLDKMNCNAVVFNDSHFFNCQGKTAGMGNCLVTGTGSKEDVGILIRETYHQMGHTDKELLARALDLATFTHAEIHIYDIAKEYGINHMPTRDVMDICGELCKKHPTYKKVKFIDGANSPDAVNSLFTKGVLTECQYEDKDGNIEFPKQRPVVNTIRAYLNWTGLGPQPNFAPMPADINDKVTIFLPVGAKVITTKAEQEGIELANGYVLPVAEILTSHRKDGSVQPYIVDCSGTVPKNIYLKYQKTIELKKRETEKIDLDLTVASSRKERVQKHGRK